MRSKSRSTMFCSLATPSGHTLKTKTQSMIHAASINPSTSSDMPNSHFTGASIVPPIPRSWNDAFLEANALPFHGYGPRFPGNVGAGHDLELAADGLEAVRHHGVAAPVRERHSDFVELPA